MSATKITATHLEDLRQALLKQIVGKYLHDIASLHNEEIKVDLKDSTPIIELDKLAKLIRAHATKLGLVLQPENFKESNYKAIYDEIKSIMDNTLYVFSLVPLFYKDNGTRYTSQFLKKFDSTLESLAACIESLCYELELKLKNKEDDRIRLYLIGRFRNACDELEGLANVDEVDLLIKNMRDAVTTIEDNIREVGDYHADPRMTIIENEEFAAELDDDFDYENDKPRNVEEKESESINVDKTVKIVKPLLEDWLKKLENVKSFLIYAINMVEATKNGPEGLNVSKMDDIQGSVDVLLSECDEVSSSLQLVTENFERDDYEGDVEGVSVSGNALIKDLAPLVKSKNDTKELDAWKEKFPTHDNSQDSNSDDDDC